MIKVRRLRLNTLILSLLTLLYVPKTHAIDWSQWNVAVKGGFGGTGIKKTVTIDEGEVEVSRSEGPGVFGFGIEKPLSDKWSLAFEHRRGFRLGPFSSGVGFTDVTWRWYYMGSGCHSGHKARYGFSPKSGFYFTPRNHRWPNHDELGQCTSLDERVRPHVWRRLFLLNLEIGFAPHAQTCVGQRRSLA
jgi:hypothetical protein